MALASDGTKPVRSGHEYQPVFIRKQINFDDEDIATGVSMGAQIPADAFVSEILVEIETTFDAGTTNVLEVGTSADDDAFVASGDVDETAAGVTRVTTGLGIVSSNTEPLIKYTQTGSAATQGVATVVIQYVRA